MREEFLQAAIQRVSQTVTEFINNSSDEKDNDFYQGMALAYKTVIDVMQNTLRSNDVNLKELGLDFDTDKCL